MGSCSAIIFTVWGQFVGLAEPLCAVGYTSTGLQLLVHVWYEGCVGKVLFPGRACLDGRLTHQRGLEASQNTWIS